MGRRKIERKKRRIPCSLLMERGATGGIIIDVSPTGLFIQTTARPPAGIPVDVEISETDSTPAVKLRVRVARQKVVPPQLVAISGRGIGVEILDAPTEYYELVGATPAGEWDEDVAPPLPSFRVKLALSGTPRSRILTIKSESNEAAKNAAVEQLGDDWEVVSVESV